MSNVGCCCFCFVFSSLCLSDQMFHICFFTYFFHWKIRIFVLLFPVSWDIFIVTIIFTMFICDDTKKPPLRLWHSSTQNQFNTTHKHKSTMNNFLSILKQNQQPPEEIIDEQKLCYIASLISIWDFFAISQANYLVSDKNAKSKMLGEYYIAFFLVNNLDLL